MSTVQTVHGHTPVMLRETLHYLVPPSGGGLLIDGTLGLAGHSCTFLDRYPGLRLVGVDADATVQSIARARLEPYAGRVTLVHAYFDDFFIDYAARIEAGQAERPSLVLLDFGLSMYHFRESGRGFSLQTDEPLDMRLDPSAGDTAADLVNGLDEAGLYRVLDSYGEEPFAGRIARAIVRERAASSIDSTARLAQLVRDAVPAKFRHGRVHPATRTFQAFRIAVNDELGRIERVLEAATASLADGGVIGCISFHSLEDRLVKNAFRSQEVKLSRTRKDDAYFKDQSEPPISEDKAERGLVVLTRKPVEPAEDEIRSNPASRSARLRVARAAEGIRP